MNDSKQETIQPVADFFPMEEIRQKQAAALDFVTRMIQRGVKHIVLSAPTGIGKSGIGVAICNWARSASAQHLEGEGGGYYLITQKLLQKQLADDFEHFKPNLGDGASMTASVDYECPRFGNCGVGTRMKKTQNRCNFPCPYQEAKEHFVESTIATTNYPYFFAQYEYVGSLPKRKVVVVDEAHTLEQQILGFIDITIDFASQEEFGMEPIDVPELETFDEFVRWCNSTYKPAAQKHLGHLEMLQDSSANDSMRKQFVDLDQHICKLNRALEMAGRNAKDWVYWQEKDEETGNLTCICKPLDAAWFMNMIEDMGDVIVYMSAFPGTKETWCKMFDFKLGEVAWKNLNSTFDVANRPVYLSYAGSMSRRNVDETFPKYVRMVKKILKHHHDQKGLIHCNSYALGERLVEELGWEYNGRLIFPKKAKDREEAMEEHISSTEPTVLISPSMTEGFDFKGDLARWQIISKVPYPYLGDKQVSAKKDRDPDWYLLQTVMTIVQAAGRIVRSDEDYGYTYLLDEDFDRLRRQCDHMFPGWFKDAFVSS